MRAVRDLRDLINVSRLSYVDSDDEESHYRAPSMFSFHSSMDFDNFYTQKSAANNNNKQQLKAGKHPSYDLSSSDFKKIKSPLFSANTPVQSSHNFSSFNQDCTRSSFFKEKSLLFERNSKPSVNSLGLQNNPIISLNPKKPLPPLGQISKQESLLPKQDYDPIQPLADKNLHTPVIRDTSEDKDADDTSTKNGNFDSMLTFIDASVVSDWLNRANRFLRKMHRWHQDNSSLYKLSNQKGSLDKYESFVNFANFWLGCNKNSKLDHKQRRLLLEMEYSIICDEVTQAFQIGIDSQEIGVADIHRLLHAVFKEYPLQLLSFRGVYLLLDYIDTLSSNRLDEYKKLLSDVKCRTVNKQHAQWLLSIRSFCLINLCWSIIKFYRNTAAEADLLASREESGTALEELSGRISSLSITKSSDDKNRSESTSSSNSTVSCSSADSSTKSRPQSSAKRPKSSAKNNFIKGSEMDFFHVTNQEKYDFYLKAVLKNDYPEVLHYLITTKKCDPYKIDEKGRTLIFLAVVNDLPKILNYLIKRWSSIDINHPSDSGNTALHAAVNQGNIIMVELLLKSLSNDFETDAKTTSATSSTTSFGSTSMLGKSSRRTYKLDVNKVNEKCMDSTPLHLAVWNDYNEIAIRLVQSNANPNLKMNGVSTAFDLALENKNEVLYELLSEYYNQNVA